MASADAASGSGRSAIGLTSEDARRRLAEHGKNELERGEVTPAWRVFVAQLTSPLILLLLGGSVVSASVGGVHDAVAILVIVGINAWVGFTQEWRAEKAVLALRDLTAARARVLRDGQVTVIPSAEVVPGDVLVLEAGDVVAADARLKEAHDLTTVEASLTGESMPVEKSEDPVDEDAPLAERTDCVFMGTSVATGTGRAVVEATGMKTEMGRIAGLLEEGDSGPTPLQKRLSVLGRILLYACLALVAVVAVLGFIRGLTWVEVLMTAVSLAVAAVPEGLPAVVTVALAVGVRTMAAHDVLIRRLSAVETLGCATVICTDKTGTLTTGVMTVREVWGGDEQRILDAAAACCDAELGNADGESTGDPTELAILRAAREHGIDRRAIEAERPRRDERPFDAERRRMSIFREDGRLYVKGAMESVAPLCRDAPEDVEAQVEAMAQRGLRVLAVATGDGPEEADLHFEGLLGIADAPRSEAVDAVAQAHAAGIEVVMITGDHRLTAHAIAREMGILREGVDPDRVVHARKTASDKTEIVRSLKAQGDVVAMTGDGVNDAPSIREADIGIAMGQTATEVTREASEMILTTDDLSGVITAVRQGRIIYDNIRKTVVYLLSGNSAELVFMLVAVAIGLPLPLLPLQLLWVNMMTEPLPGLALAVDPADSDVLRRPPRDPKEPLLGRSQWLRIAAASFLHAIVVLGVFAWALQRYDVTTARSIAFSTFVFGVLFRSFAARSATKLFWEVGALGNLKLLGVVAFSAALQVGIHLLEPSRQLFGLAPIELDWFWLTVALGFVPVSAVELGKLVVRLFPGKTNGSERADESATRQARRRPESPASGTELAE